MNKNKTEELEKLKRVYQVAKELNIASVELLDYLKKKNYHVKKINIMTRVDEKMYNEIMVKFLPEKISAEKKFEYKIKKYKLKEKDEIVEKKVIEIPVEYKKLKSKDKVVKVEIFEGRIEEEVKIEEPQEVVEEKIPEVQEIVKKPEIEEIVEEKPKEKEKKALTEEGIIVEGKIEKEHKPEIIDKSKLLEEVIEERFKKGKPKIKEQSRKLSKEGRKVTERGKLKKEKEYVSKYDKLRDIDKKKKLRKKYKKKKIDQKEVDVSIKETFARMETGKIRKKYKKVKEHEEVIEEKNLIKISEFISVAELSELMNVEPNEVIKKCLEMGLMVTINQRLDFETITMVADEFGYNVELLPEYGLDVLEEEQEDEDNLEERAPIVTIMGHVDHGKTSLLDFIRKSNIVAGEIGGITQHIGAYEVEYSGKRITFLDTPGHEAFTAMRARGAQVTDTVVLVVAADDNVMPQTVEAINHATSAQVPIIVAINKIDKPNADPEKIKKQLADINILVEDWGGKYPSVEISAKTGQGIDNLLELILIQAELLELKVNSNKTARGAVIESKLDKGRGPVATILVSVGTLKISNSFIAGQYYGKVRALLNERGKNVSEAFPSSPVQVLGFTGVPQAGDTFIVLEDERETREISLKRQQLKREQEYRRTRYLTLDEVSQQIKFGVIKELSIIIKADTDGSAEALSDSLLKFNSDDKKIAIKIIHKGVGIISESDVLLASAAHAIIIGFHIRPNSKSREIARKENVDIRVYNVIYDAIEDVKKALEGLLEPEFREEVIGTAVVREVFKISKVGTVAGTYVESGKIYRHDKIRIIRDGKAIYEGKIQSLKRFKEDIKEVASGFECGIGIENFNDIKTEDVLESYKIVEIKKSI